MLFNPFEKQFDLPSRFINVGDLLSGQSEVVREEFQYLFRFLVIKFHQAKSSWIFLFFRTDHLDELIGHDPSTLLFLRVLHCLDFPV
jgi:hypothetical protein